MEIQKQIEELTRELNELRSRQLQMNQQMNALEDNLSILKTSVGTTNETHSEAVLSTISSVNVSNSPTPLNSTVSEGEKEPLKYLHQIQKQLEQRKTRLQGSFQVSQELEDFIGTNVISKAGILITIIGVFIGAKYAIDRELISPLTRIAMSYAFAAALFFVALRLKRKYENFSSILMGGGLAVTYFITYIAFSFYQIIPQNVAFAMMVVTTAAAVGVALWYNQKSIALIGQIAAYAIPFLLGDGRGNAAVLFAYISLINVGLLVLSFKKDWKALYHIAFFLTWIILAFWITSSENSSSKFSTGALFSTINFFTFYITFLSYKIFKKQMYEIGEISILLLNALFFFFLVTALINTRYSSTHVFTWFTLANAAVHFGIGYTVYRLKLTDNTVFQFILGLGLLFVTIAIPIELNGNWVTLLWTAEGTILFYLAASNDRKLYFDLAFALLVVALLSLLQDWSKNYPFINDLPNKITVLAFSNFNFWLSLFVCSCLGYINYLNAKTVSTDTSANASWFFKKALPVIFIIVLYFTFYNELHLLWDILIQNNRGNNNAYTLLQSITLISYSCIYIASLNRINAKWVKHQGIQHLLLFASLVVNLVVVFKALDVLGGLRQIYLQQPGGPFSFNWVLAARYFCFGAFALLWLTAWQAIKTSQYSRISKIPVSFLFNFTLLCIICNEFIHWMDVAGYSNQYKLGLSIICGVYALALIFIGILKKEKHLRIGGMFLFGLTLLKLFFYDLASLSTISKTIVLVLLGILLLVASFLYNKYKSLLFTGDK